MNWYKQYKNLNAKQKRDLKHKRDRILNNVFNNIFTLTLLGFGFIMFIFWAFDLIQG